MLGGNLRVVGTELVTGLAFAWDFDDNVPVA
jgi:hypothetical protein